MKTSILLVAAFTLVAGYSMYQSQQKEQMSDIALANVEALAGGEADDRPDCISAQDLCSELVIYPDGWGENISFDHTKRPGWL